MTASAAYLIGVGTLSTGTSCVISVGSAGGSQNNTGDPIIVAGSASGTATISGVTDSAGNTYSQWNSNTAENPTSGWIADGSNNPGGPAALGPSGTITATFNSATGTKIAGAVGCPGAATSPIDQNPTTTSSAGSTSPSITSGTLAMPAEMAVAVMTNGNAGGTSMVWSGGFTSFFDSFAGAGGQVMSMAAKTTSSTAAVTAGGTITSAKWCMLLITLQTAVPVITTASLPGGTTGTSYSQALAATSGYGGYTWSVISGGLPYGLSLNAATGVISGLPTIGGTSSFTVQVTDGNGNTATKALGITIGSGTFPIYPLGETTELQLGGVWTSITGRAKQSGTPLAVTTITGGRQNQTTTATPTTASPRWNNRDNALDPDNPTGPYYGLLQQNTPCRMSIPRPDGLSYLRLETPVASWAQTAAINTTTTLDVRIDADWSSFLPGVLVSQGLSPLWWLQRVGNGTVTLWWYDSSSVLHGSNTGVIVPPGRLMLRVVLTLSTGAVQWYTAPTMGGTQTLLASAAGTGATSVAYVSADSLYCGGSPVLSSAVQVTGDIYEMQLWDGSTLKADPQFYGLAAGTTSFTDGQSNAWTLSGAAEISSRSYRAHFECAALPNEWDPRGGDVWVPVTLSGVLRRLQAGNAQAPSPMRRATIAGASTLGLLAYWPAEDPSGSTVVSSGLPGGLPMTVTGTPGFSGQSGSLSSDTDFMSSAGLPTLNNSAWTAGVPQPASAPAADTLTFFALVPSGGDTTNGVLTRMYTTGTIWRYDVVYTTAASGTLTLNGYSASGTLLFSTSIATGVNGQAIWWVMSLQQSGSAVDCYMQGTAFATNTGFGGFTAQASATTGVITHIAVNPDSVLSGTKFGQLAAMTAAYTTAESVFFPASTPYTSVVYSNQSISLGLNPVNGWAGEPAAARFARLCAENSIAFRVYGPPDLTQLMGPQQIDTLPNILQTCEDADRGIIYEPREILGLGYRPLKSLCNQTAGLVLNYGLGEVSPPLKPVRDDQALRNDAVITRNNGATVQVQKTSGPLAVATVGDYQQTLTVYVQADSQLGQIAGWMVNVGTAPGKRYPSITADMASTAATMQALQQTAATVRQGDHMQVAGTAGSPLPPGNVDQLAWGWTEVLGDRAWRISWNTVPESPYETCVLNDSVRGKLDTAGSALAAPATATAATLQVLTTTGPTWTTSGGDLPFDISAGGERITVTAIAAAAAASLGIDDGTFESGVSQWTPTGGTLAQSSAHAHTGTYSALLTVSGSPAQSYFRPNDLVPVIPGVTCTASMWLYGSSVANCQAAIDWYSAAGVYLSTSSGTPGTATTTFTQFTVAAAAPAGAAYARYGPTITGSPGNGTQLWTDDVLFTASAQAFTVTRSVNNVVKAQAAGTAVSLWTTPILALI